ncbi:type II CRISPR RNA-guided endonuclease Cas9 [Coralliovum pocilloporae]|uniref:type II CRISPR RNA-guided endonuclease Cas9 n=1 Tax=Coralliovum pocilloporae TaxID=3066369 RepID=UPI003306EAA3
MANLFFTNRLFSFDIGTNSIGWCVFGLDSNGEPDRILDIGTRIYSDGREPKSNASLAVARREGRAASRMRDRYKRRRKAALRTLIEFGLMPADKIAQKALLLETGDRKAETGEDSANPYALRAKALDEVLPPAYIGRALFHLSQRRGFKSNRKTDRKENDQGKIALGIADLKGRMHDTRARTYGEWLSMRREAGDVVRLRAGSDAFDETGYAFYPERSLLEAEFHAIWDAQQSHYPDLLTEERRAYLFRVMFYQRPLKKPQVGKCAYNPLEERLSKAHPLFQEFRLYKEVNELALVQPDLQERKLTPDQRDALIHHLRSKKEVTFKALRKTLKLTPDFSFNKESENRQKLKGDEVYAALSDKTRFGPKWAGFDRQEQWQIIQTLKEEEDPDRVFEWLQERYGIAGEQAEAIANCPLPDGHGRIGETALSSILDELKNTVADGFVIPEAIAAQNCGYKHSERSAEDEGEAFLPPYQEVLALHIPPGSGNPDDIYHIYKGRITNPTVHIGLNQLKRLVNALIRVHGKPRFMAVELARDLQLSDEQKRKVKQTITKNTRAAEARGKKLEKLSQQNNGYNRLLLKLWEELNVDKPEDRVCIYSGKRIGIKMLFSGEVDVDHILPWSQTLDDSPTNKILCLKSANRQKGNRAPVDVTEWQSRYDEILARAARLPKNKRWRFSADAMEKVEKDGGFLARQLTDTQYLSRMAREYLECLYPYEEADEHGELKRRNHVLVSPGRLTEMLRRNWGLNSLLPDSNLGGMAQAKNRKDHRHHAIDAAVVGVTTRSLLNRISKAAGRMDSLDLENYVNKTVGEILPWETFRSDLREAVNRITVSHKPDHGTVSRKGYAEGKGQTAGKLHNDTAYGLGHDPDGRPVAVHRVPFSGLQLKDLPTIRDEDLRAELFTALDGITDKKALQEALQKFRETHPRFRGIRRVRIAEALKVIPIRDKEGRAYKGYKGDANYRYDVWETLDGKWHSEVISMFDAHQSDWQSAFHRDNPTARRVLRLQQNDMVAYEHPDDGYTIARVVKFRVSGQIALANHKEAGSLKSRDADKQDPFKYMSKSASGLKKIQCRQVRIDEAGRVFDPGPQDREARKNKIK